MSKRRNSSEIDRIEFNYFIAFDVRLNLTDPKQIGQAIQRKINTFATNISNVTRRLIELQEDAKQVLMNDATYQPSTDSYQPNSGARANEKKKALEFLVRELINIIKIHIHGQELWESYIKDARDRASKYGFTNAEFDALVLAEVNKLGVNIIKNLEGTRFFDACLAAEESLEILRKKSIFDYLEKPLNTPARVLKELIGTIQTEGQSNTVSKALRTLKSAGERLFESEETKEHYIIYLKTKKVLWEDGLALRQTSRSFVINKNDYLLFLNTIMGNTESNDSTAKKYLALAAQQFRMKVNLVETEICHFCSATIEKNLDMCPVCLNSFNVLCWNCGTTYPVREQVCRDCSTPFSASDMFWNASRELDELFKPSDANIHNLEDALVKFEAKFPYYKKKPQSKVFLKVAEFTKKINARKEEDKKIGAEYRETYNEVKVLMAEKKYKTALNESKKLLSKFSKWRIDDTKKLIDECERQYNAALEYVNKASALMKQGAPEIDVLQEVNRALKFSVDLDETRPILQKYPPKAVEDIEVKTLPGKIEVTWKDTGGVAVTYTVIRKIGSAPTSYNDGEVIVKSHTHTTYEDKTVIPATPYVYAVFSERFQNISPLRSSPNPVEVFLPITNITQEIVDDGNEGIKVRWKLPINASQPEVWKYDGRTVAPSRAGEGTKVKCSRDGFYDPSATEHTAYLIVCHYKRDNQIIHTSTREVVFSPLGTIAPLKNINLTPPDKSQCIITFEQALNGKVILYYSHSKIARDFSNKPLIYHYFDEEIRGLRLTTLGITKNAGNKLTFKLNKGNLYYIYPILIKDQLFIIHDPIFVNLVDGLTNYQYVLDNKNSVHINGELHPDVTEIVVVSSAKQYANTVEDGVQYRFSSEKFLAEKGAKVVLKQNTINYLSAFPKLTISGEEIYCEPLHFEPFIDLREKLAIRYTLSFKPSANNKFKVKLFFKCKTKTVIPPLVLVKGNPHPRRKEDGAICVHIPAIELKRSFIPFDAAYKYSAKYDVMIDPIFITEKLVLFLEDDREKHIILQRY